MRRVLVIDDEADVRLLYRVNLRHAGYEVLEAEDGDHGIEAALEHLPDAMVLDLMMPRTTGSRCCERCVPTPMRARCRCSCSRRTRGSRSSPPGYELGADDVMTKPFMPEALTQGISRMLELSLEDRVAHRQEAARRGEAAFG